MPTILAGGHKIEIKDEGKTIVVDDKSFPVESEKLRIVLTDKGPKKLDE